MLFSFLISVLLVGAALLLWIGQRLLPLLLLTLLVGAALYGLTGKILLGLLIVTLLAGSELYRQRDTLIKAITTQVEKLGCMGPVIQNVRNLGSSKEFSAGGSGKILIPLLAALLGAGLFALTGSLLTSLLSSGFLLGAGLSNLWDKMKNIWSNCKSQFSKMMSDVWDKINNKFSKQIQKVDKALSGPVGKALEMYTIPFLIFVELGIIVYMIILLAISLLLALIGDLLLALLLLVLLIITALCGVSRNLLIGLIIVALLGCAKLYGNREHLTKQLEKHTMFEKCKMAYEYIKQLSNVVPHRRVIILLISAALIVVELFNLMSRLLTLS
ncbi:uncharacterized protein LOC108696906 isoform X2 [Xenopus laevis]|uniref:Uncharacterized protein LOC108696906 isoform X2 n=1 Tax=Xenopus laevis TaxID=8355 RepID=A0A8J1L876_XENLA|nr:uncharacterized protein LOC108696906 isoform X2 [Xenopus laevis]